MAKRERLRRLQDEKTGSWLTCSQIVKRGKGETCFMWATEMVQGRPYCTRHARMRRKVRAIDVA